MKKLLSIILVAVLLVTFKPLGVFTFTVSAEESGITGDCTWTLDGTTLTISGNGAMENYDSSSDSWAPWGWQPDVEPEITEVIIENGVTSIGNEAFWQCYNLTNIIIPESVISIGEKAFFKTGYYNAYDNWDDGVLYIDNYLVQTDNYISGSYSVKPGTILIADSAFYGCDKLTSITIPNSVTNIGKKAFYECSSLETVYITDMDAWCNINFADSYDSNPLYYANFLYLNNKPVTNIVVPNGVTAIAPYMFDFCTLKKITLPEGVTTIGKSAFASCEILTDINIPKSVTYIDSSAFFDCQSLKNVYITDISSWCNIKFADSSYSNPLYYADYLYLNGELITDVTVPPSVTQIKSYIFSCSNLKKVKLHNKVTKISDYAFKNCTGLESVCFPSTITDLGNSAFENCANLKSIFINKNLMVIKRGCFSNCDNITEVYYEGNTEDWDSVVVLLNNGSLANANVTFDTTSLPNDFIAVIGDIDGTNVVDLTDVYAIAKYFAGWNVECDEVLLDVNGDGVANLKDTVLLAQYVAGWDVELGATSNLSDEDHVDFSNSAESKGDIYRNAPKGEVHVLMWRKFHRSEQLLVDQYQKLTGNKVKVTITTESDYPTKLVSMVSGGNSPDVVMFQTGNFPGLVTKALQPLQNKYFHLDSDCWNKAYMDAYRINGVYFGVAQPQSWSCESSTYVTYYSPQILKNCGITTTPYQLYKQGKWNWAKQKEIALAVKNKGFVGLSIQSTDLFMLSAGVDFAKYDGSKYTNQLGSVKGTDILTKAWQEAAELKANDALTGWDLNNVQQGKVGLFSAISYGLYNEGNWFQTNFAKNLEAVPIAGPTADAAYTPVRPQVWGVPKKANNPEGAAYFLRYYLDTSEFAFGSTFHNNQFKEVYNIITSPNAKKAVMHGWGVTDYVESGTYSSICNTLVATASQNITSQLNSKKGSVNTGIARANKDLARIKA